MGILNTIENLQKKPESTRYKILIISVILIMGLIISLWLTLPNRQKLESISISGPFRLLWENIKTTIPYDFFDLLWQNIKTTIRLQ